MIAIHNEILLDYVCTSYRRADVERLCEFLIQNDTFCFRCLENGLFPASASAADDDASGYQHAWVRDNVHIAYAHFVCGDRTTAAHTARSLMRFFQGQRHRMRKVIQNPSLASDPMKRPHVRFDAKTIQEISQKWPHAQNDALGYFLWFFCKMASEGVVAVQENEVRTLVDLVLYFNAIEYWRDQDSGHWEEIRKISASSIGVVVAGLREFFRLCDFFNCFSLSSLATSGVDDKYLVNLMKKGEDVLNTVLPHECLEPDNLKKRRYDAALLFLIYPLEILSSTTASMILNDVSTALKGQTGIRRYLGDSYWCADYRDLFPPGDRSEDFSGNVQLRDQYVKTGEEAQWCIFDPIISCIYGMRVAAGPESSGERALQTHYLNRSLGQLTNKTTKTPGLQCPEAYFLESGSYVPNDHVPLQWTQANLKMALHWLKITAD